MWDLPRPGLEPVSPALAGGFLTSAPLHHQGSPLSASYSPHFITVMCPLGKRAKQRVDFVKSQKATLPGDLWKTFWVILRKEWVSLKATPMLSIINRRGAQRQGPLPSEKPQFYSESDILLFSFPTAFTLKSPLVLKLSSRLICAL